MQVKTSPGFASPLAVTDNSCCTLFDKWKIKHHIVLLEIFGKNKYNISPKCTAFLLCNDVTADRF